MASFKKEAKELGIDIKGLDDQTIKNKVRNRREDLIKQKKRLTDPEWAKKDAAANKAWAERTLDTYPSAYANMAASKYCKDPNYAKKSKGKA